jgi:carbon-monoxide dehydrogenase medium subunit
VSEFTYHRPKTLAEVWRIRAEFPEALYIAGGTDVMGLIRSGCVGPKALISLRRIDELHGIEVNGAADGGGTRIGSSSTIDDVLAHTALGERYPVLHDAARPFGSVQVRNLATVGGNLCNASPCAGMPPPLLVLDARVRLAGPEGEREIPLGEFFVGPGETCLGPDEVLTAVVLDPPPSGTRSRYLRKGRVSTDLAFVSVAVLLGLDGDRCTRARVAAGAVAPRPLRLRAVEQLLEGRRIGPTLLSEARAQVEREVSPITDVRASAEYRRHLTGVLFQRAVESTLNGDRR